MVDSNCMYANYKFMLIFVIFNSEIIADVKALSQDTSELELKTEMAQVSKGLTDLKMYLRHPGESKI